MSDQKLMAALAAFQDGQNKLSSSEEDARALELAELFKPVAKLLLYGGCFEVYSGENLVRKVYPHTIEFYYHEEADGGFKDYIVYHRNKVSIKNGKETHVNQPFFKVGSINAHQSGIDITFESEEGQYRASALIRAFRYEKEGKDIVDERSTYLYDQLFTGLQMPITVQWKSKDSYPDIEPKQGCRVNVFKYEPDLDEEGKPVKTEEQDKRPWAFSVDEFKEKLRFTPESGK